MIGLDGATLDLVCPWASQGYLPTLARLMQEGVSGDLLSTFPPLTAPAWASFMTGQTPSHHGVLEFFQRMPGSYRQSLNSARDIRGETLWQVLSQAGRRVGVVNVPLTYPPEPLNGFLISGLLTPPDARDFAKPPEILAELEAELGPYRLRHDEVYRKGRAERLLREQHEILEYRTRVGETLISNKEWDLLMIHFLGTDRIGHEFWHLLDPSHPQHDASERAALGNVVLDFYQRVDAAVARLLARLDPGTLVVLMSDHGLGGVHTFINLNTWLAQQGYIRFQRTPRSWLRRAIFRLGFNYSSLAHQVLARGLGRRAKGLGRGRREALQRQFFLSLDDVDWSRTVAYAMGNFGQIFLNLQGREPQGCVAPGAEAKRLLDDLTARLLELADPATGEKVIESVHRRDELYQGPFASQGPDLAFTTRRMEWKAMGLSDFASNRVFEPVYGTTGHHRMNGLLILHGPGVFRQGAVTSDARIYDLAPTILYAMGVPVPDAMNGQVLKDAFAPEFLSAVPLLRSRSRAISRETADAAYTDEEQTRLRDLLRGLGYVT